MSQSSPVVNAVVDHYGQVITNMRACTSLKAGPAGALRWLATRSKAQRTSSIMNDGDLRATKSINNKMLLIHDEQKMLDKSMQSASSRKEVKGRKEEEN